MYLVLLVVLAVIYTSTVHCWLNYNPIRVPFNKDGSPVKPEAPLHCAPTVDELSE